LHCFKMVRASQRNRAARQTRRGSARCLRSQRIGEFAAVQALAPIGVELSVIEIGDPGEIERDIAVLADRPNGGLIVTPTRFTTTHPDGIAALAARHKLPAVYPFRYFAEAGGLVSYGSDEGDQYRRAAAYVDRILKGDQYRRAAAYVDRILKML